MPARPVSVDAAPRKTTTQAGSSPPPTASLLTRVIFNKASVDAEEGDDLGRRRLPWTAARTRRGQRRQPRLWDARLLCRSERNDSSGRRGSHPTDSSLVPASRNSWCGPRIENHAITSLNLLDNALCLIHDVGFLRGLPDPDWRKVDGPDVARVAACGTCWDKLAFVSVTSIRGRRRLFRGRSTLPLSVVRVADHCTLTSSRTTVPDPHLCTSRF